MIFSSFSLASFASLTAWRGLGFRLLAAAIGFLGLAHALDGEEDQADRGDERDTGDGEHPRRALLGDLGAAQLHLLLQALLLERGLMALALGGLGRLDAHARLALGGRRAPPRSERWCSRSAWILRLFRLALAALGVLFARGCAPLRRCVPRALPPGRGSPRSDGARAERTEQNFRASHPEPWTILCPVTRTLRSLTRTISAEQ